MTNTTRLFRVFAPVVVLLALAGCRNPFVGMGPRVDLNPPDGEVTSISNGDYVNGLVDLSGTVEDDKEPESVWAVVEGLDGNGDPITPVTVQGTLDNDGNWQIEIDSTDSVYGADGEKDLTISLRDASGKITDKQMLLFFDNTAPVVMVTSPELTTPQSTAEFAISGEAYDPLRLDSVTATVLQGSATVSANSGSNDSWRFTVTNDGTDTYGVAIVARDRAGNSSIQLYHFADLKALNGDVSVNVVELYELAAKGTQPSTVTDGITVSDFSNSANDVGTDLPSGGRDLKLTYDGNPYLDGGLNSGIAIEVDRTLDEPVIQIDKPNPAATFPGDTLGATAAINGRVEDNVSIDPTTLEIYFMDQNGDDLSGPDAGLSVWNPVSGYSEVNSRVYTFNHSLPVFSADADYSFQIRVSDKNTPTVNQTVFGPVYFHLDSNAPNIDIQTPLPSSYIADGSGSIDGIVQDTDPMDVEISLDGGTTWRTVATGLPGSGSAEAWSYPLSDWESNVGAFGDFETIDIKARVTAGGSVTSDQYSITIDRNDPAITFITPASGTDVNGVVTLRVSVNDQSLDTVSYKIGINGAETGVPDADKYTWSENIITTNFESPTYATEISPGIWELPVTVTATDRAGNQTVRSDYTLVIDNAGDRPDVTIIYPAPDESYGGEVVVSGIATDDDGAVGGVFVQVDLDTPIGGSPDFANPAIALSGGIDFNSDGSPTAVVDEAAEYQIYGYSSWSLPLNTNGELYDTDGGVPGDGSHEGDIYVKIWAQDPITPTITSIPQILHFRFDNTLPRIDSVTIDGDAVSSYDYISGSVDLQIDASDNSEITEIGVSYDNGLSWSYPAITAAPAVSVNETIDTTGISNGNGILYLRVSAEDDNSPANNTLEVLTLNVDNDAPQGSYPGGDPVLTGDTARLQGTAWDPNPNGPIAGVDHVEVYLVREVAGTDYIYNPLSSAYDFETAFDPDIPTAAYSFSNGTFTYPADPFGAGVMTIDDINEDGDDSGTGDLDGFDESFSLSGSTWDWWVEFNSENIPDGPVTIHYVVVDKAGNRTHYSKSARIENNPPVIAQVDLGTDINYNNAVAAAVGSGETFRFVDGTGTDGSGIYYRSFATPVAGITSRNNRLYLDAGASLAAGNGSSANWLWELYYDNNESNPNLLGVGTDSVEITDFTGMPDGLGVVFLLRVTDEAGLSDEVQLVLGLENTDNERPSVTLSPLNLNHSSIIDARDSVADNNGYAVPGYLPSDIPLWGNAEGRLHSAGVAGGYDGTDADVSGKIIISGSVYDDKALNSLELTIDGYDGGNGAGTAFTILDWDAAANGALGGLKTASGVTGTAHISSESYGESAGHTVSWSFEFDTAAITGGAGDNIRISAVARDKSGNPNVPDNDVSDDNYTIDVMPFITTLDMSDAAYVSDQEILRTRYGAWPIRENSYLKIGGFNLGNIVGTVPTVAGDPDLLAAYSAFSGITVSTDRKNVTAQALGLENSGWLAMETNAVPLMNYFGDFDENDSGSESWSSDGQWTDDRYLMVWDVADEMAGSDDAVWGAMDVDPTDGSLWGSWTEYSSARVYLANQGTLYNDGVGGTGIFYVYDPSEYTDVAVSEAGNPYVVQLNNFYGGSNWTTGAGGLTLWGDHADIWNNGWYSDEPYGSREDVLIEEIERFSDDEKLWQFKNPRVFARGDSTDTDIHVAYYDAHSKALKYAHFWDNGTNIYNFTWVAEDNASTDNPEYLYSDWDGGGTLIDTNILAGDAGAPGDVGDNGSDMGLFSDITVDLAGRPVVVYYDTGNATLRLTQATSADPVNHGSTGGDWVDQEVLSNFSYVGKYPSVRIDPNGRIHITAYKVSTGDLMYYSAPKPEAVGGSLHFRHLHHSGQ